MGNSCPSSRLLYRVLFSIFHRARGPGAETVRDRILAVTVPAIDFFFAYGPGNVFVTTRALLGAFRRKGWLHSSITPSKSLE
jgi:hypothetical protein